MILNGRRRVLSVLSWGGFAAVMVAPVVIAASSSYLESRSVPYIVGGFAGIVGLSLLLLQPLLPAGYLAGSAGFGRAALAPMARRHDRRGGGAPCRRALPGQPARHDRRPAPRLADPLLGLRCHGDVGRRGDDHPGPTPSSAGSAPLGLAADPQRGRSNRRCVDRDPCSADRGARWSRPPRRCCAWPSLPPRAWRSSICGS